MILSIVINLIVGLAPHVDSFIVERLNPSAYVELADKSLKTQATDGSWPDINYRQKTRSTWDAARHIEKYKALCCAYYSTGEAQYLDAAKRAIGYWDAISPVCKNWWWNQIGVPKQAGPATILVRGALDREDIEKVCRILSKAKLKATGQNKVWLSEIVMMRAFLEGNDSLLVRARDSLVSEIRIRDGAEGIQSDWSFHQHGPQLQWGNYGLSFAHDLANVVRLLKGTELDMSAEQKSIITGYVRNGLALPLWKGYYDMNACGRRISKGTQEKKGKEVERVASSLVVELKDTTGAFYFPSSDFGIYRGASWYASVRCQSSRTVGMECTNDENMRGYFSADGALLVRRDGDEYRDVAACWDWHHVPGVTSYNTGKPLCGWQKKKVYNKTEDVRGSVEGDVMHVEMALDIDGLTGKKTWIFFDKGIICRGTGIRMDEEYPVHTAVEQCRIKGPVIRTRKWIHHNGITYIPLKGTRFSVAPAVHSGNWHDIHPRYGTEPESMELLDIYIDHGTAPKSASYFYVIIADGSSPEEAYRYVKRNITDRNPR